MARAITQIEKEKTNPVEEQSQALTQVLQAVGNSSQALIILLDILNELHQAGILEILQGMLKNRQQVGAIAMSQLNQPTVHHLLKNGMSILQFLGNLEPEKVEKIIHVITHGIERSSQLENEKPLSFWDLTKMLRSPEVSLSIHMIFNFLRGMGEELNRDHPVHDEGK
ncbi:DUF1641 domain-containing protein [Thermoflavimicrobium daqui]|jgi:uncharacterized protein YjgD (DUF1641 family)|uniref:DUF1641 domain-containing protein n=1 Tax=Thermoflavimicrobium daqui TaxID=2137476 RepID=A0A364K453_9BACL|nr:DUF1641 domain-containing protein [Thermoflavimicrobium daqui]RAL24071.1 hypothetical protein DL897_10265 [Thermoflavimicrobium daqui]